MQYEVQRLASFDKWPVWAVKRPVELAGNGFYYCGHGDQVKCYFCGGQIGNWSVNDDVVDEHSKQFPHCRFVQNIAGDNRMMDSFSVISDSTEITESCDAEWSLDDITDGNGAGTLKQNIQKPAESGDIHQVDELLKQMQSLSGKNQEPSPQGQLSEPMNGYAQPAASHDAALLRYENYRRQTFEDQWPESSLISPVDLAKAGFYYVGPEDIVRCAFCKGRLRNWKATDNPMLEHRKHYPHCQFVQGFEVGNVSAETVKCESQKKPTKKPSPCERLGVMIDKPRHPEYAVERARMISFKNWPKSSVVQPEDLVKAGFFYLGYSDNVRCFFCDGGLQNWKQGDDPWSEHAVWFSRCGFLKLTKGEKFIEEVHHKASGNLGAMKICMKPSETGETVSSSQQQIDAWMNQPHVKTVIGMGFSSDLIKKVLQQRCESTGEDFPNFDAFLDAVLNMKDDTSAKSHRKRKNKKRKKKKAGEASEIASPLHDVKTNENQEEEDDKEGEEEEESAELEAILSNPTAAGDEELTQLAKQYERLKEERKCKICMDAESNIVFLPCGHVVCCPNCSPALRTCPICRKYIKGSVKMYLP